MDDVARASIEAIEAESKAKIEMWGTLNTLLIKLGLLVDAALDKIAEDAFDGSKRRK